MNTLKNKIITALVVVVVGLAAYTIGAGKLFAPATASASLALYDQSTVTSVYNAVSPAVVEVDVTEGDSNLFKQRSLKPGSTSSIL